MYVLKVVVKVLVAQLCPILCNPMDCSQQAPLSMGFPRQEYWSRLPFSSPGDLPNPGIEFIEYFVIIPDGESNHE